MSLTLTIGLCLFGAGIATMASSIGNDDAPSFMSLLGGFFIGIGASLVSGVLA